MKLYRVLFLIFFSGILFVGVVNDISAYDHDHQDSYTAIANAYRYGGIHGVLHVRLYASASSSVN